MIEVSAERSHDGTAIGLQCAVIAEWQQLSNLGEHLLYFALAEQSYLNHPAMPLVPVLRLRALLPTATLQQNRQTCAEREHRPRLGGQNDVRTSGNIADTGHYR